MSAALAAHLKHGEAAVIALMKAAIDLKVESSGL